MVGDQREPRLGLGEGEGMWYCYDCDDVLKTQGDKVICATMLNHNVVRIPESMPRSLQNEVHSAEARR